MSIQHMQLVSPVYWRLAAPAAQPAAHLHVASVAPSCYHNAPQSLPSSSQQNPQPLPHCLSVSMTQAAHTRAELQGSHSSHSSPWFVMHAGCTASISNMEHSTQYRPAAALGCMKQLTRNTHRSLSQHVACNCCMQLLHAYNYW